MQIIGNKLAKKLYSRDKNEPQILKSNLQRELESQLKADKNVLLSSHLSKQLN